MEKIETRPFDFDPKEIRAGRGVRHARYRYGALAVYRGYVRPARMSPVEETARPGWYGSCGGGGRRDDRDLTDGP